MKKLRTFCTILALSCSCMARDSTADDAPPAWFSQARQAIEVKNYDAAIRVLTQADEKQSADWHNLMGFSLRLKTPPQLQTAELHYQTALKINPVHLGALEYYGELFLLKKDMPGAQNMLTRLERACPSGCEELSDLQKSIAEFKAKN